MGDEYMEIEGEYVATGDVIEETCKAAGVDVVPSPCEQCSRCTELQAQSDQARAWAKAWKAAAKLQRDLDLAANEIVTVENLQERNRQLQTQLTFMTADRDQLQARFDAIDAMFPAARLDDIEWNTPLEGRISNYIESMKWRARELTTERDQLQARPDEVIDRNREKQERIDAMLAERQARGWRSQP